MIQLKFLKSIHIFYLFCRSLSISAHIVFIPTSSSSRTGFSRIFCSRLTFSITIPAWVFSKLAFLVTSSNASSVITIFFDECLLLCLQCWNFRIFWGKNHNCSFLLNEPFQHVEFHRVDTSCFSLLTGKGRSTILSPTFSFTFNVLWMLYNVCVANVECQKCVTMFRAVVILSMTARCAFGPSMTTSCQMVWMKHPRSATSPTCKLRP